MMASQAGPHGQPLYDRWLLLALWEVQLYGRDSFGDPDYVAIYGLKPHEWHARGARIVGRTAVECKRDRLASLIGGDIAASVRAAPATSLMVVDLFAGSCNTLHWIKRHTGARRAVGFELDDTLFELTRTNLSIMSLDVDLRHDSFQHGPASAGSPRRGPGDRVRCSPWGHALGETSGLDLRRTQPPVSEIIDTTSGILGHHKLLFALQVHETVQPESLAELTTGLLSSAIKVDDINAPGHNHGLLLSTRGWALT